MQRSPFRTRLIFAVLSSLCILVLLPVVTNIATNTLPEWLQPYTWLAWPTLVVLALVTIGLVIFEARSNRASDDISITHLARARRQMLAKVRHDWIDNYLKHSLHELVRIELGLKEKPDSVSRPWNLIVQQPDREPQPLPSDQAMGATFDKSGQTLLILGAPGSGKTTLLLELTRDLLKRAEQDEGYPIPTYFHLSTFHLSSRVVEQHTLADWLVNELVSKRYGVLPQIAQHWIEKEQILPLLDGLDEVAPKHRAACAEAINKFRKQHGLIPLAVCCRTEDYEALAVRLELSGAIVIEPLSRVQINTYLEQAGKALAGVRTVLQDDETLWELLKTPLMLSIVALAYQGRSAAAVRATGSLEQRRTHLFENYTRRMFERRSKITAYTSEQTLRWLIWLARSLTHENLSVFYVKGIKRDWLPSHVVAKVLMVLPGLLGGLVLGLVLGLSFMLDPGRIGGLGFGLSLGADGLFGGLGFGLSLGLLGGLVPGLLGGRVFGLSLGLLGGLVPGLVGGLGFGLGLGLSLGLSLGLGLKLLSFLRPAPKEVGGLVGALVGGMLGGLVSLLVGILSFELADGLFVLLVLGLILMLFFLSVVGEGMDGDTEVFIGLIFGLMVGALVGGMLGLLVGEMRGWRVGGLGFGLSLGLSLGLFGGLIPTWANFGENYILRVLLWRNSYAPWNFVRFLDYAAERVFLRKVGSSYIFIHRLVMEYFGTLQPTDQSGQHQSDRSSPYSPGLGNRQGVPKTMSKKYSGWTGRSSSVESRLIGRVAHKEMPSELDQKPKLYCSFCGKSQYDVELLLAGERVFICNKCVDHCGSIIVEARRDKAAFLLKDTLECLGVPQFSELKNALVDFSPIFQTKTFSLRARHCFYLSSFSGPFNGIYADHVMPAVTSAGFSIERADELFGMQPIMEDIWIAINSSEVIIADVTARSANVMYQIGIAHTVGRPVVIVSQCIDDVPFDLRRHRCLVYEYTPKGCRALEEHIIKTLGFFCGGRVDS